MVTTGKLGEGAAIPATFKDENYDRASELKAFDETKAGVKGLVDAKISEIPRIFLHSLDNIEENSSISGETRLSIPVIDLKGLNLESVHRKQIVEQVREASETWGFFQIINHGIPESVLEDIKDGVRRFYEQDTEVKKEFYTREPLKPLVYNSNFDLFTAPSANWRDTFYSNMAPNPPNPNDLPSVCRYIYV